MSDNTIKAGKVTKIDHPWVNVYTVELTSSDGVVEVYNLTSKEMETEKIVIDGVCFVVNGKLRSMEFNTENPLVQAHNNLDRETAVVFIENKDTIIDRVTFIKVVGNATVEKQLALTSDNIHVQEAFSETTVPEKVDVLVVSGTRTVIDSMAKRCTDVNYIGDVRVIFSRNKTRIEAIQAA